MAKRAADRFQTAVEVAQALKPYLARSAADATLDPAPA
jgi:hypothetical protein